MGLLSKLNKMRKKGLGSKLLKKAASKDPIAKAVGVGQSSGKRTGGMGQRMAGALGTMGKMKTGGPAPKTMAPKPPMRPTGDGMKLNKLANKRFNRP